MTEPIPTERNAAGHHVVPTTTTPETIDLTPTTTEYANLAEFFARAVLDDARDDRRKDTAHLLGSVVELVAYLARHDDGGPLLDRIKRYIKGRTQ